ncbi:DEAD/DEAH box helicase family protein [Vibrio sp. Isolate30]|uniref:DEAD/DEAH box helicase family protein n=1 Tax=Vibrio sp. Isolate30 TaxID=2908536 RepID=UPI001EFC8985|nr:DEAD/DEAH box helicase family protein [Vibrio sp. Isolate30]MCG9630159.1 DEAD/DEAH box helicase family protein [Vibrio sp. Isolate30]
MINTLQPKIGQQLAPIFTRASKHIENLELTKQQHLSSKLGDIFNILKKGKFLNLYGEMSLGKTRLIKGLFYHWKLLGYTLILIPNRNNLAVQSKEDLEQGKDSTKVLKLFGNRQDIIEDSDGLIVASCDAVYKLAKDDKLPPKCVFIYDEMHEADMHFRSCYNHMVEYHRSVSKLYQDHIVIGMTATPTPFNIFRHCLDNTVNCYRNEDPEAKMIRKYYVVEGELTRSIVHDFIDRSIEQEKLPFYIKNNQEEIESVYISKKLDGVSSAVVQALSKYSSSTIGKTMKNDANQLIKTGKTTNFDFLTGTVAISAGINLYENKRQGVIATDVTINPLAVTQSAGRLRNKTQSKGIADNDTYIFTNMAKDQMLKPRCYYSIKKAYEDAFEALQTTKVYVNEKGVELLGEVEKKTFEGIGEYIKQNDDGSHRFVIGTIDNLAALKWFKQLERDPIRYIAFREFAYPDSNNDGKCFELTQDVIDEYLTNIHSNKEFMKRFSYDLFMTYSDFEAATSTNLQPASIASDLVSADNKNMLKLSPVDIRDEVLNPEDRDELSPTTAAKWSASCKAGFDKGFKRYSKRHEAEHKKPLSHDEYNALYPLVEHFYFIKRSKLHDAYRKFDYIEFTREFRGLPTEWWAKSNGISKACKAGYKSLCTGIAETMIHDPSYIDTTLTLTNDTPMKFAKVLAIVARESLSDTAKGTLPELKNSTYGAMKQAHVAMTNGATDTFSMIGYTNKNGTVTMAPSKSDALRLVEMFYDRVDLEQVKLKSMSPDERKAYIEAKQSKKDSKGKTIVVPHEYELVPNAYFKAVTSGGHERPEFEGGEIEDLKRTYAIEAEALAHDEELKANRRGYDKKRDATEERKERDRQRKRNATPEQKAAKAEKEKLRRAKIKAEREAALVACYDVSDITF